MISLGRDLIYPLFLEGRVIPDLKLNKMIKKRNLIVFDIDGTLTDTVDIHQKCF
jgi:hypothetical protein